jgi:multisubunit Na+/H+ antiporter MnhB subunit
MTRGGKHNSSNSNLVEIRNLLVMIKVSMVAVRKEIKNLIIKRKSTDDFKIN